jgi:two-component system nitrate/nitrite response regulator NarL
MVGASPPAVRPAAGSHTRSQPQVADGLSVEDRRLWRLIASGSSTGEIAVRLHVSERTVKRLTASLLRRRKVASRAEAAALAGRSGVVDEDG